MKYRYKPVVIEAVQWNGKGHTEFPIWLTQALDKEWKEKSAARIKGDCLEINTLGGVHKTNVGDYIIQGIEKELYSCKSDIFKATYEKMA